MSRWIAFAGITAMLVTGYFATLDVRGQGFLRSVKHIPSELQTKVEIALRADGMTWARVDMDGQRAILSGTAPSELDRDDAMEATRRAAGRGGSLWGGITAVDGERIKLSPPRKPYKWSAKRGNGQSISLSGVVPSQRFKRQIAAEARKLFPKGVEDRTVVAGGHPTGDWAGTALIGLQQLQKVQSGEVQFDDGVITLFGQTRDDGERAAIETAMSEVRRPFSGSANLSTLDRVDTPPPEEAEPEPEPAPAPAVAPVALAEAPAAPAPAVKTKAAEPTLADVAAMLTEVLVYLKKDEAEDAASDSSEMPAPAVVEAAAKTETTTLSRVEKDAAGAAPVPAKHADSRLSRTEILKQFNEEKDPLKRTTLLRKLGL